MNHRKARLLVETYVEGWKKNDLKKIADTLSQDCVIIESHGPTYRGIKLVQQWIESWVAEKSQVDNWDITSFHFLGDASVFEWNFECTVSGQHYSLEGMSIVEYANEKIVSLREYRRTRAPYEWSPE